MLPQVRRKSCRNVTSRALWHVVVLGLLTGSSRAAYLAPPNQGTNGGGNGFGNTGSGGYGGNGANGGSGSNAGGSGGYGNNGGNGGFGGNGGGSGGYGGIGSNGGFGSNGGGSGGYGGNGGIGGFGNNGGGSGGYRNNGGFGNNGGGDPIAMLANAVPGGGVPGQDYPILASVPNTGFTCQGQLPGYYADTAQEAGCQVFHICQEDDRIDSFLCPNGTIFNQQYFVCDWWFNFDCSTAEQFYGLNAEIGKVDGNGNGFGNGNNGYGSNGNGISNGFGNGANGYSSNGNGNSNGFGNGSNGYGSSTGNGNGRPTSQRPGNLYQSPN